MSSEKDIVITASTSDSLKAEDRNPVAESSEEQLIVTQEDSLVAKNKPAVQKEHQQTIILQKVQKDKPVVQKERQKTISLQKAIAAKGRELELSKRQRVEAEQTFRQVLWKKECQPEEVTKILRVNEARLQKKLPNMAQSVEATAAEKRALEKELAEAICKLQEFEAAARKQDENLVTIQIT